MILKTIDDSHIKLQIEIHRKVCLQNTAKPMFYGSVIKTTSQSCGIQHQNL
jgi:hypothetical protein